MFFLCNLFFWGGGVSTYFLCQFKCIISVHVNNVAGVGGEAGEQHIPGRVDGVGQ